MLFLVSLLATAAAAEQACTTTFVHTITTTYPVNPRTSVCNETVTLHTPSVHTIYTGKGDSHVCPTQTSKIYGDLYTDSCCGRTTSTFGSWETSIAGPTMTDNYTCTETVYTHPTTTKQNHICAPSNLITQLNGQGIHYPQLNWSSTEIRDVVAKDSSDCCQICLDTPRCAAMWMVATGYCELVFPADTCGEAFKFPDHAPYEPDSPYGYVLQSGCGSIIPVVYVDNIDEKQCHAG